MTVSMEIDKERIAAERALRDTPMEYWPNALEAFVRHIITIVEIESADPRLIEGDDDE